MVVCGVVWVGVRGGDDGMCRLICVSKCIGSMY